MTDPDSPDDRTSAAQRGSGRRARRRHCSSSSARCATTRRSPRISLARRAARRDPPSRASRNCAARACRPYRALLAPRQPAPIAATSSSGGGVARRRALAIAASFAAARVRARRGPYDVEDAVRRPTPWPPALSPILRAPRSLASRSTSPPRIGTRSSPGLPPARQSAPRSSICAGRASRSKADASPSSTGCRADARLPPPRAP